MPSELQKCALCGKPAYLACRKCENAPIIIEGQAEPSTWYCSFPCQSIDKLAHEEHCERLQARKLLYRAGRILGIFFFKYNETRFSFPVVSIHRGPESLHVGFSHRSMVEGRSCLEMLDRRYIGLKERYSILHAFTCHKAAAWMHDMVNLLLKDLAIDIREVTVREIINPPVKLRVFDAINRNAEENLYDYTYKAWHEVQRITLHTGDRFVLDLSGAQFGNFKVIMAADAYYHKHILKENGRYVCERSKDSGSRKKGFLELIEEEPKEATGVKLDEASCEKMLEREQMRRETAHDMTASEVIRPVVEGWLASKDLTVKELLQLGQNDFDEALRELMRGVGVALDVWKKGA